jgi:hypothetical protein
MGELHSPDKIDQSTFDEFKYRLLSTQPNVFQVGIKPVDCPFGIIDRNPQMIVSTNAIGIKDDIGCIKTHGYLEMN